jgi:hypothetical protein
MAYSILMTGLKYTGGALAVAGAASAVIGSGCKIVGWIKHRKKNAAISLEFNEKLVRKKKLYSNHTCFLTFIACVRKQAIPRVPVRRMELGKKSIFQ